MAAVKRGLRRDRVTTTSAMPSNSGDEDVPFLDGNRLEADFYKAESFGRNRPVADARLGV
jgi:hypothetical protein